MDEMKTCTTCGVLKSVQKDFYPRYDEQPGYTSSCKPCQTLRARKYRATVPPSVRYEVQYKRKLSRLALVNELKSSLACADCGVSYPPPVMEFDHRPGEEKLFPISMGLTKNIATLQEEINKCDLVCANCHRMRGISRGWPGTQKRAAG